VLQLQGKLEAAEASYREALRLAPDDLLVVNHLSYLLVEQNKNLTEALQLIQRAVSAQPTNAEFLHTLGWAYFKLDQLEEAERYLSESVQRDKGSALHLEHLGDVYARRGNTHQAHDAWSKALSLSIGSESKARLKEKLGKR
jgi:Flp pilus assembly protein TadD